MKLHIALCSQRRGNDHPTQTNRLMRNPTLALFGIPDDDPTEESPPLEQKSREDLIELAKDERCKELSEDLEHYSELIDKREQQLAAERESSREISIKAIHEADRHIQEIQDLRAQLATEKGELVELHSLVKINEAQAKTIRELVDALEKIAELYDGEGVQAESIAKDALAKIGK